MDNNRIQPDKITRPLQLLAAWLTGLIIINGAYLTAAVNIKSPDWASAALIIACIIHVPLFLFCIFLLQTKFRPEMQEDQYYSLYLLKNNSKVDRSEKKVTVKKNIANQIKEELKQSKSITENTFKKISEIVDKNEFENMVYRDGGLRTLAELYIYNMNWGALVNKFKNDISFQNEIAILLNDGLITYQDDDYKTCKLTEAGLKLAKYADELNILWRSK